MSRLPRLTGGEIITTLAKAGFFVSRVRGSLHRLRHPDERVTTAQVRTSVAEPEAPELFLDDWPGVPESASAQAGLQEFAMPTIAYFYGIAVQMFYNDHPPPHVHARYGRAKAIVRLADGEIIAGELPPTAARLVREWTLARRAELEENWRRARAQEPLERVPGPDVD